MDVLALNSHISQEHLRIVNMARTFYNEMVAAAKQTAASCNWWSRFSAFWLISKCIICSYVDVDRKPR